MIGNVKRLPRLPFRPGCDVGVEMDTNGVFTGPHGARHIGTVTSEAIVRTQDRDIVDEDDRDGIEIIDIEIPAGIGVIEDEGPLYDPVPMRDPLHRIFIGTVIGVLNDARVFECAVNVSRHGKVGRVVSFQRGQAPEPGQIDDGFGRGGRNHDGTLHGRIQIR
ncbi:hypothetical protein D3C87_1294180 [compost metagenome]